MANMELDQPKIMPETRISHVHFSLGYYSTAGGTVMSRFCECGHLKE